MRSFRQTQTKLLWIGAQPQAGKEVALLIPQFNEVTSCKDFQRRLQYFNRITLEFSEVLDVIIIDDGSTDGTLNAIRSFKEYNNNTFFLASVSPNMNKVGAIYATILEIRHEMVVLSDFDTDLIGLGSLFSRLNFLRDNSSLMGCYFRMLPFGGRGMTFLFQQLEYSMARSCYKLYEKEYSVPVMPGAGCCYKRTALTSIYEKHSGLRSGEDRESTLIGLKLGYKTFYLNSVTALTRPPSSFKSLLRQRTRWNLGYLETFQSERSFYFRQIGKLTGIGLRTLYDIIRVTIILLLPFIVLSSLFMGWQVFIGCVMGIYFMPTFWSVNAIVASPDESVEFRDNRLRSILFYPLYKISLDSITWWKALISLFKKERIL